MTRTKDRTAYFSAYNKRRNALPETKAYQRGYHAAYQAAKRKQRAQGEKP